MIVITGAAGFIGSCLVSRLNSLGREDLVLVDSLNKPGKENNLKGKLHMHFIDRKSFPIWLEAHAQEVTFIFHLGARTDTTEFDTKIFDELNLHYSQTLWKIAAEYQIPMLYASSAATYGDGEYGYNDDESMIPLLKPLNPYGQSKQDFDAWVLQQKSCPHFWAGLKFFNVYGPNEYHKGRMASVILHSFNQIKKEGKVKLFRSHKSEYTDGGQLRDFIYVRDVVDVLLFLFERQSQSGIYNLGTGKARSFLDLANAVFHSLEKEPAIEFIDTPEDIRDKYQYFTEANMSKLREAGYIEEFTELETGISDYVRNYLSKSAYL